MSDSGKGGGSTGAARDGSPGPARPGPARLRPARLRPARLRPARRDPAAPAVGRASAARGLGKNAGPRSGRREAAGGARARRAP